MGQILHYSLWAQRRISRHIPVFQRVLEHKHFLIAVTAKKEIPGISERVVPFYMSKKDFLKIKS